MPENKKITVIMPKELLSEVDVFADKKGRSEFMRCAAMHYIRLKKRMNSQAELKKGYLEMGQINLDIANGCFEADCECLENYEKKIAEK